MKSIKMVSILRKFPLFDELSEKEIFNLSGHFHLGFYSKGDLLFNKGAEHSHVYFILSGSVKSFFQERNGNEKAIEHLSKGEIFPITNLFKQTHYPASAKVIKDSTIISIPTSTFKEVLLNEQTLKVNYIKMIQYKIMNLEKKIQDHIFSNSIN